MPLQSQVKRASAKVFLKIIKSLKNQDSTGWAMTFDNHSKKWFSLDNEGRVRFASLGWGAVGPPCVIKQSRKGI